MTQLLQNAVYGTALILAAAVLRRALGGRLIPEARLILWAVCLFRLLTPAAPASVLSLWGLLGREAQSVPAPFPAVVPGAGGASVFRPANAAAPSVPEPAPVEAGIPWETLLPGLWLAAGLALGVWYVVSYVRTRRAVGCAVPVGRDDPRYSALPRCARLREGPVNGAPLTFGAVRPTVVLTPGLEGEVLECVLAHEGVHARRRDNLWHYAMAAALVLHWWNPAVWLMARLLRRDVELSCDRAAVKRLGADRRAEYAQALVSLATRAEGPAFCQTFGRKAAEERIIAVMKYRKTTVIGAALTLALVLAVTVGFASNPAEKKPSGGLLDKPVLAESAMQNEDGTVTEYTVNLDVLKQNLDRHVAEGTMTQEEADRVWAQAQDFAQGGKALTWSFQGDSGLTLDELHNVCYRDENGKLIPVDPATVASGFIFPAADTVVYHGRTFNRADLSAETLEWLDWYQSLSEEGQMAVSFTPPELWDEKFSTVTNADQPAPAESLIPEFVPDYDPYVEDSAGLVEPIVCAAADCTVSGTHYHENGEVIHYYNTAPAKIPVCPVEGCTTLGSHTHNGTIYACNGAHCGGVCDGSCKPWSASPSASGAGGHHGESHHSGHH